jgi:hypothetical protein
MRQFSDRTELICSRFAMHVLQSRGGSCIPVRNRQRTKVGAAAAKQVLTILPVRLPSIGRRNAYSHRQSRHRYNRERRIHCDAGRHNGWQLIRPCDDGAAHIRKHSVSSSWAMAAPLVNAGS